MERPTGLQLKMEPSSPGQSSSFTSDAFPVDISAQPGFSYNQTSQQGMDFDLEPQLRARSNTWPLHRPEDLKDEPCQASAPNSTDSRGSAKVGEVPKKSTSRRNAWGNMSYADLITQAIQCSPEQRLTLSQIYDWMVQNVPYFKDKGDSNSSAGWKNSIRHNLSLHNRFMRVQNEGTGKSSWWMINPDAKPGKAARRRATSMETSKYEKKRGRVKKKVEDLRNANGIPGHPDSLSLSLGSHSPASSSSVSEGLDLFPESPLHQGFPGEFRARTASNASSGGNRLSPISGAMEPDSTGGASGASGDGGNGGGTSTAGWPHHHIPGGSEFPHGGMVYAPRPVDAYLSHQLADNLAEGMKLAEQPGFSSPLGSNGYSSSGVYGSGGAFHPTDFHGKLIAPQRSPQLPPTPPMSSYSLQAVSPAYGSPVTSQPGPDVTVSSGGFSFFGATGIPSIGLRAALASEKAPGICPNESPTTMMGQLMGAALNNGTSTTCDIDLNLDSFHGGLECNVDELIKQELSMEGSLDFTFPHPQGSGSGGEASVTVSSAAPPGSWVR